MVLSDEKVRGYIKRLLLSRMRILINNGFYGLLLMHIGFALDENISTAATDGEKIMFSPDFLDTLSDRELDFVLMHEIVHIALRHYDRIGGFDNEKFNIACDIVVNSNILLSENMDKSAITLGAYGESMHLAPDGSEGYNYTVEQLYSLLPVTVSADESDEQGNNSGSGDGDSDNGIMVTAMMATATTVTMTMIMMVTATVIIRANQNFKTAKAEKAVKNRESQTIVLIKTVTGTTIHIGMNIKQTMNY